MITVHDEGAATNKNFRSSSLTPSQPVPHLLLIRKSVTFSGLKSPSTPAQNLHRRNRRTRRMSMRVGNRYPTTTAYNYTPHPDHHPNPSMASSGHRYGHSTASSSGAVASTSSSTTVNTNMNANVDPQVINVHTPTYAYAILHAAKQESLSSLLAKLASKQASIHGHGQAHIGRGWVKYEWNDSLWNLDDDSDYTIFIWRFSNHPSPTLHIHDPSSPLPNPNEDYINSSFFLFRPPPPPSKFMSSEQHAGTKPARSTGTRSTTSKAHSKRSSATASPENRNGVTLNGVTIDASGRPTQKFKNEQGVRTVIGSIGPVKGGQYRLLIH
jgi:hypothetical protein